MVAVVNGIMSEAEAKDLWFLRREMIRNELTARALMPNVKARRNGERK